MIAMLQKYYLRSFGCSNLGVVIGGRGDAHCVVRIGALSEKGVVYLNLSGVSSSSVEGEGIVGDEIDVIARVDINSQLKSKVLIAEILKVVQRARGENAC